MAPLFGFWLLDTLQRSMTKKRMRFQFAILMSLLKPVVTAQSKSQQSTLFRGSQSETEGNGTNILPRHLHTANATQGHIDEPGVIRLAGIFDTTTYNWGPDVFHVTVRLINEGKWDILPPGFRVVYDLENAKCGATTAARAYWKLRKANGNKPMHGIVGARCSAPSVTLARIAGLEGVPQISPASQSTRLSNDGEFPYFSRLMAPNNEQGESKLPRLAE